jgi:hypothetical protein
MLTRFDPATLPPGAGRHGRRAPAYAVQRTREVAPAAPAMPVRRMAAKAAAPFARPGRLADLLFARGFERVAAGRAPRSIRVEFAERWFGDDLVAEIDPNRLEHELVEFVDDGGKPVHLSHWFLDSGDWTGLLQPLRPSESSSKLTPSSITRTAWRILRPSARFSRTARPGAPRSVTASA